MSTLKVATIQDLSSANSSTPEQIAQGRAKAWVNFNGTGTVAIRDDYFCSSITDNGAGDYTVNFDNAMPSANYAMAGHGSSTSGGYPCVISQREDVAQTTNALRFKVQGNGATFTAYDATYVSVAVFGD